MVPAGAVLYVSQNPSTDVYTDNGLFRVAVHYGHIRVVTPQAKSESALAASTYVTNTGKHTSMTQEYANTGGDTSMTQEYAQHAGETPR